MNIQDLARPLSLRRFTLALLLLLLLAVTAWAQSDPQSSIEKPEPVTAESVEQGPTEADLERAIDEAEAQQPAAVGNEPPQVKAGIERFDPTEEISEDRSVSFPNDI